MVMSLNFSDFFHWIRLIRWELWKTRMSRWTVMTLTNVRDWGLISHSACEFPVHLYGIQRFFAWVHYIFPHACIMFFCMSSLHFRVKHIPFLPPPSPVGITFLSKTYYSIWDKTDSILLPIPIPRNTFWVKQTNFAQNFWFKHLAFFYRTLCSFSFSSWTLFCQIWQYCID